ncbi:hypothetical protein [Pseudovibrio sp. SPO723]|uniref:hypothetical protein n=1 Tax=Nesiotobacter zosterae TaxID=392721 RepID=UPI0029C1283A|nr:hypothetical protein [Pseudovibrio sp. SPO723]MDX5594731.1 hypothetical protein [Pseudovibrio sp. SPO723]
MRRSSIPLFKTALPSAVRTLGSPLIGCALLLTAGLIVAKAGTTAPELPVHNAKYELKVESTAHSPSSQKQDRPFSFNPASGASASVTEVRHEAKQLSVLLQQGM